MIEAFAKDVDRFCRETAIHFQEQADRSLKIAVLYREAAITAFGEGEYKLGGVLLFQADLHHASVNVFNKAAAACQAIADD